MPSRDGGSSYTTLCQASSSRRTSSARLPFKKTRTVWTSPGNLEAVNDLAAHRDRDLLSGLEATGLGSQDQIQHDAPRGLR